jgi:hypothetical protein
VPDTSLTPHEPSPPEWRRLAVRLVGLLLFALALLLVPHRICRLPARAFFDGAPGKQRALAAAVERRLAARRDRAAFSTGSKRFDGEWLFGSLVMGALGFGQVALEHPGDAALRARHAALVSRAIDQALATSSRAFDREAWGEDAVARLEGGRGHAAFLGYLGLALGLERLLLDQGAPHAALHDRLAAALEARLAASPTLLVETYPGEAYPVDNCAVAGTLALHSRATGRARGELLSRFLDRLDRYWLDPETRLLYQAVDGRTGSIRDRPRGSGSMLASYFLSFVDLEMSRRLYVAATRRLYGTILGFGLVREYPRGEGGRGDIDSGPIVLGYGVSATGFALGPARLFGDGERFGRLYATAHLFGAPSERGGRLGFVLGGPIGDAILFAMLTATPRAAAPARDAR